MNTMDRRTFMRVFAGATFAATATRFFVSNADTGVFPTRFLFVYSSAGRDTPSLCTGTGAGFTLGAGYAALEPWRKKILVLDGLRIPTHASEEHPSGRASMLSGMSSSSGNNIVARGPSIDRYLADKLNNGSSVYTGQAGPGGDIDVSISWHAANTANDAFVTGPEALLGKLFSGMGTPTPKPDGGSGPSAATQDELALNDYLMSEVQRLEKVAPKSEAEKLQLHLIALQQIRANLSGASGTSGLPTCSAPPLASVANDTDKINLILAHAFACGAARMAVVRLDLEEPHHQYSHWNDGADYRRQLQAIDVDTSASFARLLGYLDGFKEGAGTLLDHTLVVWSSEVSGSHGGDGHGTEQMPFILAGGLGGKIKLGQRIVAPAATNAQLYRSVAQAMGVPNPTFGDPSFGSGLLTEILV
jgi:Protein of unknown function (DUF1552)